MRFVICSVLLLCVLAQARVDLRNHPAIRSGKFVAENSTPSSAESHFITIAVKQSNLDKLEETFWDVSNPLSRRYGKYLSLDEVADLVAPEPSTMKIIMNWLHENGLRSFETVATKDVIFAEVPVANINKMLNVQLEYFRQTDGNRRMLRSLKTMDIPAHIAPLVDYIKGVNDFPLFRPRVARRSSLHAPKSVLQERLASEVNSSAPVILSASIRDDFIEMSFVPKCLDGSTTATYPLCQDHPPAVTHAYMTFDDRHADEFGFNYIDIPCDLVDGVQQCKVNATSAVPYNFHYTPWNASIQLVFGADSLGKPGYNPFPVVYAPPVTPQSLGSLYNIPPNYKATNTNNSQSVAEFEQQYYSPSDLTLFMQQMGLVEQSPVKVIGPNPDTPGVEANLDIQYLMGVGQGVPTTFWSIKANSSIEIDDILTWCFQVGNDTNPPLVHSVSYGMTADHVDKYLGQGYLARSDVEFQKLSVRGITIIIASGDTGAGDLGPPPMSEPNCTTLHPDWPSQSPFITSVGSTYQSPIATPICYREHSLGGIDCRQGPLGEVGVSLENGILFTSGGGFSEHTSRPAYQESFVADYLTKAGNLGLLPPDNMWNSKGRGYPDFATIGHNAVVAQEGKFIPVDGTSASAPIFGGVISLLNDVRLNAGKPALGFLNPLFYHIATMAPQAFYDVTVGSNRCGAYGWTPVCCTAGYHALPGWDSVSGLGSPNFEVLAKEILKY